MSDIKFYCPSCSAKLGINRDASGKKINCPECKTPIEVPKRSTRGGNDKDIIQVPPSEIEATLQEFSGKVSEEIEEIRDAVGKLQRHLTSGKSDKVSRSEFDGCLKSVMHLQKNETTYKEEIKTFQKDYKALEKALEKIKELNLGSHEKQIAKADDKLKDVKDKLQPLTKGLSKVEKLEETVKALSQEVSKLKKTDITTPVDKLKEEFKALQTSQREDTKKAGVIEKQQETLQKKIDELNTKLKTGPKEDHTADLKKMITAIEETLSRNKPAELKKAITALETKLSKDQTTDLRKEITAQNTSLGKLEKTISKLEAQLKENDKRAANQQKHIDELTTKIKQAGDNQSKAIEKAHAADEKRIAEMTKDTQKMWGIIDARFGELDANGPSINERLVTLETSSHRMKEFAAGFGTRTAEAIKTLQTRIEEIINPEMPDASGRDGPPLSLPENFDELVFQQANIERKINALDALVKMTSSRVQIIENSRHETMDNDFDEKADINDGDEGEEEADE